MNAGAHAQMGAGDVAYLLGLEALALRVVAALRARDVDALIMKGPVTNRWLYGGALTRRFSDIDILVPPADQAAAEAVLTDLQFRNDHERVLGIHRPDYEASWSPSSGVGSIDLHTRIAGIPAARAEDAWRRLQDDAGEFTLHGQVIATLSETARTMVLALHAARSREDSRAQGDLEIGLTTLPEALWRAAAGLALELDAGACFSLGLRRSARGRALARSLDFPQTPSLESLLLEREAPQEAHVLAARLAARPSARRSVRSLFTTESAESTPLRAVATALAACPGALLLVLRLKRQLRRARREVAA